MYLHALIGGISHIQTSQAHGRDTSCAARFEVSRHSLTGQVNCRQQGSADVCLSGGDDTHARLVVQGSRSETPISLGDSSAPEDSDFLADDSEEEDEDDEADSPEPMRRPYQMHVKNRALHGDVEIIEEEANEAQYQRGDMLIIVRV